MNIGSIVSEAADALRTGGRVALRAAKDRIGRVGDGSPDDGSDPPADSHPESQTDDRATEDASTRPEPSAGEQPDTATDGRAGPVTGGRPATAVGRSSAVDGDVPVPDGEQGATSVRSAPVDDPDERAVDLADQIGAFAESVDPGYTARAAYDGTKRGVQFGPYGALVGAGAGVLYGAFESAQEEYDPDDPSIPVDEYLPDQVNELRSRYATAAAGYRYGGRLGTYGRVVGTAIGAGIDVVRGGVDGVTPGGDDATGERADDEHA